MVNKTEEDLVAVHYQMLEILQDIKDSLKAQPAPKPKTSKKKEALNGNSSKRV